MALKLKVETAKDTGALLRCSACHRTIFVTCFETGPHISDGDLDAVTKDNFASLILQPLPHT